MLKESLTEAQKQLYFFRARVLMAEKTSLKIEATLPPSSRAMGGEIDRNLVGQFMGD